MLYKSQLKKNDPYDFVVHGHIYCIYIWLSIQTLTVYI